MEIRERLAIAAEPSKVSHSETPDEEEEAKKKEASMVADIVTSDEFMMVAKNIPMEVNCLGDLSGATLAVSGMKLCGSAGMMVGRMYARNTVHNALVNKTLNTVVKGVAQSAIFSSRIEMQAVRHIVVRIPVYGQSFADRFMKGLGTSELDAVASGQLASTISNVAVRGRVLVFVAQLLTHELVEFSWLLARGGQGGVREFLVKTAVHFATALGSLGGGVVGTAVGTMAMPGVGTGVGSLAGSLIGASFAEYAVAACAALSEADAAASAAASAAGEQTGGRPQATGCIELMLTEAPSGEVTTLPDGKAGPVPPPSMSRGLTVECEDVEDSVIRDIVAPEQADEHTEAEVEETEEVVYLTDEEADCGFLLVERDDTSSEEDDDDGNDEPDDEGEEE